ncbi:L,D-transpeptidase [Acidisoma sp.]|uniref:L,D-transpeptidase n=1 Tax=Acidisoma sp. TaxID=1872115 RepID=UPI003AFFB166
MAAEGLVGASTPVQPLRDLAAGAPAPAPGRASLRLVAYVPAQSDELALSPASTVREATTLRQAMAAEVAGAVQLTSAKEQALIVLAQRIAGQDHLFIRQPQLVLIVDRAPQGQLMAMTLAQPDGDWEVLGARHVSTGKPGRLQHFKTPVGVLLNDGSELGYRAQGTFNQNHIRGLGVKGMRVWDFGWQTSDDWRTPGATMEVRVEMHATDPDVLEERIGRADSEGCIRLPDSLNRFLDRRGIIDADIERLGQNDIGYRALLSPELEPTPLAGDAVIVVDSSEPSVKPYPPVTNIALSD